MEPQNEYFISPLKTVQFLAVSTTILQFLSGSLVCRKVIANRTPGDTSAFPFICGFLSTVMWFTYGFLKGDSAVILVNFIGAITQLTYVIIFYKYSKNKSQIAYQFSFIILAILAFYGYLNFEENKSTALHVTGFVSCLITIMFIAAPLVMLVHVLKVKSTESLPFPVILMSFFVSVLWFFYGCLIQDQFMMFPNAIGGILAATQLSLFVFFPSQQDIKYAKLPYIT